jgi:FAD/FMN-containing dehydrogenase
MGLTGVILSARIQLAKVETAYCRVSYKRTRHLDESLECFEGTDQDYRYSVAWIDCLASGKSLGRSVVMRGNDAKVEELPGRRRATPLSLPAKRTKNIPFFLPGFLLNSHTVRAFNGLFYAMHGDSTRIVDFDSYFYPLDAMLNWNRLYGKRGFIQYQAFFPREHSRQGLVELLETLASSRKASFLAVLKSCGAASRAMLSFLQPGHTLALDLANTGEDLQRLVRDLDELVLKHGGRLYLAKDALTSADAFQGMYRRLDEFRAVKSKIDPQNRFLSSQARRLGIVASE